MTQPQPDTSMRLGTRGNGAVHLVVVAPTYNNAGTLLDVLCRVEAVGLPIIVVNDGATDETPELLAEWVESKRAEHAWVILHPENRGKASALRTGFAKAEAEGFTHAVTIDTDGQLDPEQIPELVGAARASPEALILGRRSDMLTGMPPANRFAWWLSALGIWLNTGRRVPDSQCGLRVYPLSLLRSIRCRSRRFGFETESVIRAAWADAAFVHVPVRCRYEQDEGRVSHFVAWRDGPHSFLMQAGMTLRRLLPWPHAKVGHPTLAFTHGGAEKRTSNRGTSLADWIDPRSLWRQLRRDHLQHLIVAGAVGIGSFMANMPVGWVRILLAIYAARRLHVHLLPVLFGLAIMWTPLDGVLSDAALNLGHLVCHASLPDISSIQTVPPHHMTLWLRFPLSYSIGCVTMGFLCNWLLIGSLFLMFRLIPTRARLELPSR